MTCTPLKIASLVLFALVSTFGTGCGRSALKGTATGGGDPGRTADGGSRRDAGPLDGGIVMRIDAGVRTDGALPVDARPDVRGPGIDAGRDLRPDVGPMRIDAGPARDGGPFPMAMLVGLDLSPPRATAAVGTKVAFVATARFSDGSTRDVTGLVAWQSSVQGVAAVAAGTATARSPGASIIEARLMSASARATLTVTPAPLTSLSIEPAASKLPARTALQLRAIGTFADGTKQDLTSQVVWGSSNEAVAAVGPGGVVQGRAEGTTTIIAELLMRAAKASLEVTGASLTALEVSPANPTLPLPGSQRFTATGVYSDGTTADLTAAASWSSSDPAVLQIANGVGSAGVASAAGPGSTTIAARIGNVTGSTTATVARSPLVAIRLTPEAASLPKGVTQAFRATGAFLDGTTADVTSSVAWSTGAPAVAAVSNAPGSQGLVTALAEGTTELLATAGGVTGGAKLQVTSATVTTLAVSPPAAAVAVGSRVQFTLTATFSDGASRDVTELSTWSVSDPAIAAGSNAAGNAGQVTGLKTGGTEVKASFGGRAESAKLTVTDATLERIAIDPDVASTTVGRAVGFKATGTYSDGSTLDLTTQVTWASDAPMIASVSNAFGAKGTAQGNSVGTATIAARLAGRQASAKLTVTAPGLVRISLEPIAVTRRVGDPPVSFNVVALFENDTARNVTGMATLSLPPMAPAELGPRNQVSCRAQGTVNVTATFMGQTDVALLTCTDRATLAGLQITPFVSTLRVGAQSMLQATALMSDGATQSVNAQASWTSSDPLVVDVSTMGRRGQIVGVSPGTATITATYMNQSATATVTVRQATPTSLNVSPSALTMRKGQTQGLQATVVFDDGTTQNVNPQSLWSSSDPAIADVSNGGFRGQVTALAAGTTTITATHMGLSDRVTVTVTASGIASLRVTPASARLAVGQTQTYAATLVYDDATTLTVTSEALWGSSDPTVADVSNAGLRGTATAFKPGTTTVTVSYMGVTGSAPLTVTSAKIASLSVTPPSSTVRIGQTQPLAATAVYDDGTTQNVTNLAAWSSSDGAVAEVSNGPARGVVTGGKAGSATITATLGGLVGSATVAVSDATVTELQVTPTNPILLVGRTQAFTATAIYSDFSTRNVTGLATWSSSQGAVAQVGNAQGSAGAATGLSSGTTTITATFQGVTGATAVTVSAAAIKEIQVSPAAPRTPVGLRTAFSAVAVLMDNTALDVTSAVTWTSSEEGVVAISNAAGSRGVATALTAGASAIRATLGGVTGETTFTVGAQKLTAIGVSPATATIAKGATQPFAAVGMYDDGSMFDLTTYVTWIATAPGIAAISNVAGSRGLATALAAGATTIEAHFDGKKGTAALTVAP